MESTVWPGVWMNWRYDLSEVASSVVMGMFSDSDRSCQGAPEGAGVYESLGSELIILFMGRSVKDIGNLYRRGGVNGVVGLGLRSFHSLRTRGSTPGTPQ